MAAFSVQDAQSQRFLPVENSPAPLCSISMGGKSGGYTYYIRSVPAPSQSKPVGFARFPLLSLRDIFPRSGGSLSSRGELFAVCRSAQIKLPLSGELASRSDD